MFCERTNKGAKNLLVAAWEFCRIYTLTKSMAMLLDGMRMGCEYPPRFYIRIKNRSKFQGRDNVKHIYDKTNVFIIHDNDILIFIVTIFINI